MLQILQAKLQHCIRWELPEGEAQAESSKRQRNQRSNYQYSLDHGESKGVLEKNIYFCFINYTKAFDSVDHN